MTIGCQFLTCYFLSTFKNWHTIMVSSQSIYFYDIKITSSLKLDDSIFGETEKILGHLKTPRNRYINEAISYYNKIKREQILKEKLELESKKVREDSMSVLKDFEAIDYVD